MDTDKLAEAATGITLGLVYGKMLELPRDRDRADWRESRRISNIARRRGWMHVARLWRRCLAVKRMYYAIDRAREASRIAWRDYGRLS